MVASDGVQQGRSLGLDRRVGLLPKQCRLGTREGRLEQTVIADPDVRT